LSVRVFSAGGAPLSPWKLKSLELEGRPLGAHPDSDPPHLNENNPQVLPPLNSSHVL